MARKYRLFDTASAWDDKETEVMAFLNIPIAGGSTVKWADISEVDNPDSPDEGKFIFPVQTSGPWDSSSLFDSSDLVDYDPDWIVPPPFPPDE